MGMGTWLLFQPVGDKEREELEKDESAGGLHSTFEADFSGCLMLVMGVILLLVAWCGCWGSIEDNKFFLLIVCLFL